MALLRLICGATQCWIGWIQMWSRFNFLLSYFFSQNFFRRSFSWDDLWPSLTPFSLVFFGRISRRGFFHVSVHAIKFHNVSAVGHGRDRELWIVTRTLYPFGYSNMAGKSMNIPWHKWRFSSENQEWMDAFRLPRLITRDFHPCRKGHAVNALSDGLEKAWLFGYWIARFLLPSGNLT